MKYYFFAISLLITLYSCHDKYPFEQPWNKIFEKGSSLFKTVIAQKDQFELQIIYTQVKRDTADSIALVHHYFNQNDNQYFYPASTVKMPVAFLALEHINELKKSNAQINEYSTILFDSIAPPQSSEWTDNTSPTGYPNVSHYIEKIFSVSDNNAFNRLYEFLGQDLINDKLVEKGIFSNSKIIHRVGVSGFDRESNKYTNPYKIIGTQGDILYSQNELYALYNNHPVVTETIKGVGRYDDKVDSIINEPFNFTHKNFISLTDLQNALERIIFPRYFDIDQRFDLTDVQIEWLKSTMSKLPKEYDHLKSNEEYYDSYVKFLMYGDSKEPIPNHIDIYNKVGWAYGYLTDCAYIVDRKNNIDFFLSATIHVNGNQIYNDGVYEYDSIGIPFLAELGELVYQYELSKL